MFCVCVSMRVRACVCARVCMHMCVVYVLLCEHSGSQQFEQAHYSDVVI